MKRLALLLGSLLVVSAAVSAKEVVPAPVVVEETPVQIIEKEVIVYRDREPEWRPSGFAELKETYYGRTEFENYKHGRSDRSKKWNDNNEYLRTQLDAGIQMTENFKMDFRGRTFQGIHEKDNSNPNMFRVRGFYNHGNLGDSKVTALSRVKYQKDGQGRGDQTVEYGLDFDFAAYMFSNDYVKTSRLVVGPVVSRTWSDSMWKLDKQGNKFMEETGKLVKDEDGHWVAEEAEAPKFGYVDSVGLYFNWVTELPFGFGTDLELDSMAYKVGNKKGVFSSSKLVNGSVETKAEKTKFVLPVKFLITHNYNLYANDDLSLDWYAEGGFDTFDYSNRASKAETKKVVSKEAYTAYVEPSVTLTYHATKFVDVFGKVGGTYKNWKLSNKKEAANWRWQPYAEVGVNAKF